MPTPSLPTDALRRLPAVGVLITHPLLRPLRDRFTPALITEAVRVAIAGERARLLAGESPRSADALAQAALAWLDRLFKASLRRVVNGTGVVINTNLGRSPLAPMAVESLLEVAGSYSNLEIDLESGKRGSRHTHVAALLCELTGAEAALVVNNCAAAVLLICDTYGRGREVVVSRGQLIEIGGSFRLPEVISGSGARLVEVGTTNKTYLDDYARALRPETGMLLLSHTSNYRIVGFTSDVDREALAQLGRSHGVVTCEDLGSGLFVDLTRYGIPSEPTVQASVAAGLDLIAVSGDKLMGGPQCGVIVGREALIRQLKANPLMRALRPDKLALAALEGTLRLYLRSDQLEHEVPIFGMLARTPEQLKGDAEQLIARIDGLAGLEVSLQPGRSAVGGGTLPGVEVPTWLVALRPTERTVDQLAHALRTGEPAVVGRIAEERLLLDPRTFLPGDVERVVLAVERALA